MQPEQATTRCQGVAAEVKADVDGNVESRAGTISTFRGQPPLVEVHPTEAAEQAAIAAWLKARIAEGVTPSEMAVFVRSEAQLPRAQAAITAVVISAGAPGITVTTMHQAKGLEFRAVVVAACDDEVIPLQTRIESVTDNADLEDGTTPSATCSTSPAPAPGTGCW